MGTSRQKSKMLLAVGALLLLIAYWLWFVGPVPPESLGAKPLLADPLVPPGVGADTEAPIAEGLPIVEPESRPPHQTPRKDAGDCPPGDPMCGGL
jgi:hypothetical protein